MSNRKKYYGLDNIGFVGTATEKSAAQVKADIKQTSDLIKNYHASSAKATAGAAGKKQPPSNPKTKEAVANTLRKK